MFIFETSCFSNVTYTYHGVKHIKSGGEIKVAEILVGEDRDIFNPNNVNFDERTKQLEEDKKREEEQLKRDKKSPFKSFVQMNKKTYALEDRLMQKNPLAYRIWRFLANNMDGYNAVIVSQETLTELFEVSRTTIWRAIKILEDDNYIRTYKSGTSNVYALNDDMVWNSWGTNKKYSKFSANVIISESEQTEEIKKELKDLKTEKHKEVKF